MCVCVYVCIYLMHKLLNIHIRLSYRERERERERERGKVLSSLRMSVYTGYTYAHAIHRDREDGATAASPKCAGFRTCKRRVQYIRRALYNSISLCFYLSQAPAAPSWSSIASVISSRVWVLCPPDGGAAFCASAIGASTNSPSLCIFRASILAQVVLPKKKKKNEKATKDMLWVKMTGGRDTERREKDVCNGCL